MDINKIKDMISIIDKVKKDREFLIKELSNLDITIQELLHKAEFGKLSASKGYDLYKRLHIVTNKRRNIKNEISLFTSVLDSKLRDISVNYVSKKKNKFFNKKSIYKGKLEHELGVNL